VAVRERAQNTRKQKAQARCARKKESIETDAKTLYQPPTYSGPQTSDSRQQTADSM
jgi:hypothetical protein